LHGQEALSDCAVGGPHIEADRLDLGKELRAKPVKASDQGLLRALGQHVQVDVPILVYQHAVGAALTLAVGDLVYTQLPQGADGSRLSCTCQK